MNSFTKWMEDHFVPVAAKIGSEKHLVAVRDAFISIMPITMAGAVATLINVFVRDLPTEYLPDLGIADKMSWLIGINGNVWWGTLAMLSVAFVIALGYQLSKAYNVNPLPGGLVAFASFIAVTPQVATIEETVGWGFLNWAYLDAKGLFTALIIGFISTLIYAQLMRREVTIKLPDSVPPAVSNAFSSIIPGLAAIYATGALAYVVGTLSGGKAIGDLVLEYVQMPFLGLSQGLGAVVIVVLMVQLFWFFGLHGTNVLGAVLDGTYLTATTMNETAAQVGDAMPFLWARGSFDAYVWMGGAGTSIALIIAVLIFSKRAEQRAVAKMSAPMGAFNINEPVVFGMPVVLNPIYFIPWVLVPVVLTVIAWLATYAHLVPPVHVPVPWVVPPVIYAWLATGGSFAAALLALFNLAVGVGLWSIFVILANKFDVDNVEEN